MESFSKRALQSAEIVDEDTVPYESYWGFLVKIPRSDVEREKIEEMLDEFYELSGFSLSDYGEEGSEDCRIYLLFMNSDHSLLLYVESAYGSKYVQLDSNENKDGINLSYDAMQTLFKIMDSIDELDVLPEIN